MSRRKSQRLLCLLGLAVLVLLERREDLPVLVHARGIDAVDPALSNQTHQWSSSRDGEARAPDTKTRGTRRRRGSTQVGAGLAS